jgi:hypothetical protein
MNANNNIVLRGRVKPDGSLDLELPVSLPPGPVRVTVEPLPELPAEATDPFWTMMDDIWAGQKARGNLPRGPEQIEAAVKALRDDADAELGEVERIHDECRQSRGQAG